MDELWSAQEVMANAKANSTYAVIAHWKEDLAEAKAKADEHEVC